MSSSLPPLETISTNDHAAQIVIVDYMLLIFSAILVLARGLSRYQVSRLITPDDLIILSALVLAIPQSICVQLAVSHGLGKHQDTLSSQELDLYSKFNYASQILLIAVLACAKICVSQLIKAIKPHRPVLLACQGLELIIVLWAVSSIFALSFQCRLPTPWDFSSGHCVNQASLYYYISIMNLLTDVGLIILPILMMFPVQVSTGKKLLVISLFASRILVVAMTILQLVFLTQYLSSLGDATWSSVPSSILLQVIMNLSIMTACIPSLKRVIADLQTGGMAIIISENVELSSAARHGQGYYAATRTAKSGFSVPYGYNMDKRMGHTTSVVSHQQGSNSSNKDDARWAFARQTTRAPGALGKSSSSEQLREDVITRTVQYKVEYEDEGGESEKGLSM